MSHRGLPNDAERMAIMRHLADVASLKGDLPAQRQLLIDGLNDMFRTTLGWLAAVDDWRVDRTPRPVVAVMVGRLDPAWQRYVADFGVRIKPTDDPFGDHSLRSDDAVQVWGRHRVVPDLAAAKRYHLATELSEEIRIGDGTVALARVGPGGHRGAAFSLHRARDDPMFTPLDFSLHRFALTEIRGLIERGHLPLDLPPAGLSPRLQQLLEGLLAGHTPKRIARDLGLSVWTIRDHMKRLYAHFDVTGRDQLMARFIRGEASAASTR